MAVSMKFDILKDVNNLCAEAVFLLESMRGAIMVISGGK